MKAGATIAVTNNGVVAAILVPPNHSELERIRQARSMREARTATPRFDRIRRVKSPESSASILNDLRGER